MAHLSAKSEYLALQQRLDRLPMGAPAHKELFAILEDLYSTEECRVAAAMPFRMSTAEQIAKRAEMESGRVATLLAGMAPRGLVIDVPAPNGQTYYMLNPPVVGFFEFTMMRVRTDIDQKKIAQHMWSYFHDDPEHAFMRMIAQSPTFLARPLVHEDALEPDVFAQVLDYEKATEVIDRASAWSEGICHCRHVKQHLGERCEYPLEFCLSLGMGAEYLIRNGLAKRIDKARALDVLVQSREMNMVQMCDNVKNRPVFICNCCKCCCEFMSGLRSFPQTEKIVTSNYVAKIDENVCTGCGKCMKACPIEAISQVAAEPTAQAKKRKLRSVVDADRCLGCGVCHRTCKFNALQMNFIGERIHTPESILEKVMLQAVEQGKLQHLIFDDQARFTHRAMSAVIATLLKLPTAKQLLAGRQIKSKFVDVLIDRFVSAREKEAVSK